MSYYQNLETDHKGIFMVQILNMYGTNKGFIYDSRHFSITLPRL